jgi:hypothetical protein
VSHDHLRAAAGVGSAGVVSVGAAPLVVVVSVGFAASSFLSAGFADFLDLNKPVESGVGNRSKQIKIWVMRIPQVPILQSIL